MPPGKPAKMTISLLATTSSVGDTHQPYGIWTCITIKTKRFLYENDRSMRYLLEDSYRTTTYHFVVDDPPPLWVHPDQRIIVKTTDQIHLPFSTCLLHQLEHHVAKSSLRNLVIHHETPWLPFKQDSVSPSKRIYFENNKEPPSASSRRKPCNDISLC